jgi:hypothetical protein
MIMKKFFLLAILAGMAGSTFNLAAQREIGISYRNRNLFGAGMTLVSYRYEYAGSRSIGFPPLTAYMEIGMLDNITVGPFAGYSRWNYVNTDLAETWNYTWSFSNAGVRGSLHLTRFLNNVFNLDINENRTDWYVTLIAGIEYRQYSTTSTEFVERFDNEFNFLFGPLGGVRYYLGSSLGFYFEAGLGNHGIFATGMSLRL